MSRIRSELLSYPDEVIFWMFERDDSTGRYCCAFCGLPVLTPASTICPKDLITAASRHHFQCTLTGGTLGK